MYIKIFRNYLTPRTSNVETHARDVGPYTASSRAPKTGLTAGLGSDTHNGSSSVSNYKVNDDPEPFPMHASTPVRVEPMTRQKALDHSTTAMTVLQLPTSTELPHIPSSLSVPSLDDGDGSPTITPVLETPSPSPVTTDSASTLTISSSSPVSTPTYPAPILATPIVQGPAPKPGNGTANAANQSSSQSQSSGPVLSGGAIAAISVVAIMVALALGLWLYRKWSISKRKKRLTDWWLPEPFLIGPDSTTKKLPPMEEKDSQVVRNIPRVRPPSLPLPAIPAYLSGPDSGASVARRIANIGMVRCIFEPRMADELKIRVGDSLRVLAEYDDGWGFCENVRGERGMIPLECLEGGNLSSVGMDAAGLLNLGQPSFARTSARKSSLLTTRA